MGEFKLQVGDVVSKPDGFMDWTKWEHRIWKVTEDTVYTVFDNGMPDSKARHATEVLRGADWMSIVNMQSCLQQPGTVVHRPTPSGMVQVWPEVEG